MTANAGAGWLALSRTTGRDEIAARVADAVGTRIWEDVFEQPASVSIERAFHDDVVRGVVLTDALIGTHADAADPSLKQNRCLLYHVIGDGVGEWRVPVGGMGAVTGALYAAARDAGARFVCDAEVTAAIAFDDVMAHRDAKAPLDGFLDLARWADDLPDRGPF